MKNLIIYLNFFSVRINNMFIVFWIKKNQLFFKYFTFKYKSYHFEGNLTIILSISWHYDNNGNIYFQAFACNLVSYSSINLLTMHCKFELQCIAS